MVYLAMWQKIVPYGMYFLKAILKVFIIENVHGRFGLKYQLFVEDYSILNFLSKHLYCK